MSRMRFTSAQSAAVADKFVAMQADRETLVAALKKISDMDPEGLRADDLGRAARIARDAIPDDVGGSRE